MGAQLYGYTAAEHEYSVSVPQLMTDDPELMIYVSAHGGGTVGESYADNGWDYMVAESGSMILQGSDIRSPEGRAAGHAETARSLASFLSAYGESFRGRPVREGYTPGGEYSAEEAEWLSANYERLSMFSADGEGEL
jgi:hypothetical protein